MMNLVRREPQGFRWSSMLLEIGWYPFGPSFAARVRGLLFSSGRQDLAKSMSPIFGFGGEALHSAAKARSAPLRSQQHLLPDIS
jgi:hypothetical protein